VAGNGIDRGNTVLLSRNVTVADAPSSAPALPQPALRASTSREVLSFVRLALFWIVCLKALLLVLDPTMRLFMGDSATYFVSAVEHSTPPDRSFTYPMLIRLTAVVTGSITTLLLMQSLFGALTAAIVAGLLRFGWGVRPSIALLAAVVVTLDPSQLFYERMIMTESASSLALWATVAMAVLHFRSGSFVALAACIVCGVGLSSLRVGLVPVAFGLPVLASILRMPAAKNQLMRWIGALVLAMLATAACHQLYKGWYAERYGGDPAYIHDAGLFRLGLVAPLVKPAYFEGTGVDPAFLDKVRVALKDPLNREAQIWNPGGLIPLLREQAGDRANTVAATVAARAMSDQPVAMLRMGLLTQGGFFDHNVSEARLLSDMGEQEAPDARTLAMMRSVLHYDAAGINHMRSFVLGYYAATSPWLVLCLLLLAPLSLVVAWRSRHRHGRLSLFLAIIGLGFVIGQVLCSHIISFRYLHPLSTLTIFSLAILLDSLRLPWTGSVPRPAQAAPPVLMA
jgi:hypothetical protein